MKYLLPNLYTENVILMHYKYNFSLSDCHLPNFPRGRDLFSLLSGPSLNPVKIDFGIESLFVLGNFRISLTNSKNILIVLLEQ